MMREEQTDWSSARAASGTSDAPATEETSPGIVADRAGANSAFGFFLVVGALVSVLVVLALWVLGRLGFGV